MYQFRDKKQIVRNKKIRKNIFVFFILCILSFLIILLTADGFWQFISRPFLKSRNYIENKSDENGYIIRNKESVYKKNRELIIENINLNNRMLDYEILKKENQELKELFGRIKPEYKFILGNILSKPSFSPYDTIIIDIGENLNIQIGDVVYANSITPIGEIDKVYSNSSSVVLYSNPNKVTVGMIEGTNNSIEIVGRGGGNFEMTTPVDLYVEKGKSILLPSMNSEIIAIVGDIISIPNDPIKKFLLKSPINIQNLKWVEVKVN